LGGATFRVAAATSAAGADQRDRALPTDPRHAAFPQNAGHECLAIKVGKGPFEAAFRDYLGSRRPRREYLRLFRTIVRDVCEMYRREEDRLRREIDAARSEYSNGHFDDLHIDGVLNFAEHLLLDGRQMWEARSSISGSGSNRRCFQAV
jgi:hypothetical protein